MSKPREGRLWQMFLEAFGAALSVVFGLWANSASKSSGAKADAGGQWTLDPQLGTVLLWIGAVIGCWLAFRAVALTLLMLGIVSEGTELDSGSDDADASDSADASDVDDFLG